MGRDQAARYIVADTAGRDAAVGRRPAADHRRHGEPDDAVGTSRGATDRVRARRRPDPGPDVRSVLRPEADRMLASAAFQLTVTKTNGEVTRLVAAGAGSGHAVGMCQWGAIGRARAGQDYRKILTTYFPGTKIEKVY